MVRVRVMEVQPQPRQLTQPGPAPRLLQMAMRLLPTLPRVHPTGATFFAVMVKAMKMERQRLTLVQIYFSRRRQCLVLALARLAQLERAILLEAARRQWPQWPQALPAEALQTVPVLPLLLPLLGLGRGLGLGLAVPLAAMQAAAAHPPCCSGWPVWKKPCPAVSLPRLFQWRRQVEPPHPLQLLLRRVRVLRLLRRLLLAPARHLQPAVASRHLRQLRQHPQQQLAVLP